MSMAEIVGIIGLICGSGGFAAFYGTRVTKKLGISTNENQAKTDLSQTWEAIVSSLQKGQLDTDERLATALRRLDVLDAKLDASDTRERILYGHIFLLESGYPPPVPSRPEGI